jgi:hypothetical protein
MMARDILGFAIAALIALLVQAVAPWTGVWWLGMVSAALVAAGALIDMAFRHYRITVDRTIVITTAAVTMMLFVGSIAIWQLWPVRIFEFPWADQSQHARFHTIGTGVGFSSQTPNQLVANIYFQNDAGDADIVVYWSNGVALTTVAPNQTLIDESLKYVADVVQKGDGIHFKVRSKEGKWFTILGPVLSNNQVENYNKGELTFYFVSTVLINEQGTIRSMDNCSFVTGNNPNAIIECPSLAARQ